MKESNGTRARYLAAGVFILLFIAAQAFQEVAYRFWIPVSHGPQDDLLTYLHPIDQARALLILGTIIGLIVPFAVVGLRYRRVAPLASVLGVVFGAAFIGFELSHRSIDFFVVGAKWAPQFSHLAAGERGALLQRFALWNDAGLGLSFPIMVSYLLASGCFVLATLKDDGRRWWYYLAPSAYGLNALRLVGRLLSTFAGQGWLDALNNRLYFPVVLVVNALLAIWFFALAGHASPEPS